MTQDDTNGELTDFLEKHGLRPDCTPGEILKVAQQQMTQGAIQNLMNDIPSSGHAVIGYENDGVPGPMLLASLKAWFVAAGRES